MTPGPTEGPGIYEESVRTRSEPRPDSDALARPEARWSLDEAARYMVWAVLSGEVSPFLALDIACEACGYDPDDIDSRRAWHAVFQPVVFPLLDPEPFGRAMRQLTP